LFDLAHDPNEQQNLLRAPQYFEKFVELDAELTQAIMHSVTASHYDRRVYEHDLSQDAYFGREGWQRIYPQRLGAEV
jgi:hypothetical protein